MRPCICPTCKGSPPIIRDPRMPPTYLHEFSEPPRLKTSPEPLVIPQAISVPPKVRRDLRSTSRQADDPFELIRAIQARTDIGNGMKAMQIKNIKRKYGVE